MTYSITGGAAANVPHGLPYRARTRLSVAALTGLLMMGCADMSSTQQRTLSGAGIGAAGGAVVGAIAGDTGLGAAVGAAAGAAGGYLYDKHEQSKQRAYEQGLRDGEAQGRY